ncbi:hypothetical protein ACO0LB_06130 [Undibacterium sp. SXout7W]|uniref:hypothetical protein n=1 Tax=Undibacterium sp. SXout7W TaxID=3413049 RepID=UPI003BF16313
MRTIKLIAYLTEDEARALAVLVSSDAAAQYCHALFAPVDVGVLGKAVSKLAGALNDCVLLSR